MASPKPPIVANVLLAKNLTSITRMLTGRLFSSS
jgi:hypothetical protein